MLLNCFLQAVQHFSLTLYILNPYSATLFQKE